MGAEHHDRCWFAPGQLGDDRPGGRLDRPSRGRHAGDAACLGDRRQRVCRVAGGADGGDGQSARVDERRPRRGPARRAAIAGHEGGCPGGLGGQDLVAPIAGPGPHEDDRAVWQVAIVGGSAALAVAGRRAGQPIDGDHGPRHVTGRREDQRPDVVIAEALPAGLQARPAIVGEGRRREGVVADRPARGSQRRRDRVGGGGVARRSSRAIAIRGVGDIGEHRQARAQPILRDRRADRSCVGRRRCRGEGRGRGGAAEQQRGDQQRHGWHRPRAAMRCPGRSWRAHRRLPW